MAKYSIASKDLGKTCEFKAEAEERQEAVRQALEHAKSCPACAGVTEAQANAAIREHPAAPQPGAQQ